MTGAPCLVTERLELWQPAMGDLPGMVELLASAETRRYLGAAEPGEKAQFERLLRHAGGWALYDYGNFYLRLRGDRQIIGNCGVFHSWRGFGMGLDDVPEAGWMIHHAHCGRGYAAEAMHAALAWFDRTQGAQRIACMIEAGNAPSERLAARLGFVPYGQREEADAAPLVLYERLAG